MLEFPSSRRRAGAPARGERQRLRVLGTELGGWASEDYSKPEANPVSMGLFVMDPFVCGFIINQPQGEDY